MTTRQNLREHLATRLQAGDFQGLVALAGKDAKVVTALLQFLYNPRDLLQWRAIEGLGHVAAAYPRQVQKLIGRLLWLLNEDSGSFGWGAAAALGEIARRQLDLVAEIIPMFCGFLEEEFSRESMLWGVGRLAEVHPDRLDELVDCVAELLGQDDPQVRGLAAWCLGKAKYRPAIPALRELLQDERPVCFYDDGEFCHFTVARLAREALASLEGAG
jgi:HEAT repeat protein